LKLVDEVKRNMNQNYVTGVLFFDFSDAFGTVNRAKLLYKLHTHFNVSGRLFLYLVSFLSERKARITVNDLIGEWIDSDHGTSAGTILGAILFLVYVHDTNVCDCEQGIEDVHHFLFKCTRYRAARKILLQTITSICDDAECNRRLMMTVSTLLNPEELQIFTKKQCSQILTAVFVFIRQSGRRL